MTVVWYIIAHAHQVCAANLEGQNQSILSRSEPGLNVVSQSSEQFAQAKPANHSWQTELSNSVRQPSPYKPTVVYVYVRLNTVSQINLPDKTYNVSAEIVLEWQDGRLAFMPNSQEANTPLKFNIAIE